MPSPCHPFQEVGSVGAPLEFSGSHYLQGAAPLDALADSFLDLILRIKLSIDSARAPGALRMNDTTCKGRVLHRALDARPAFQMLSDFSPLTHVISGHGLINFSHL